LPGFADSFAWRKAFEGLQAASEVIGSDEVGEVHLRLVVAIVRVPFDGRCVDPLVHPLDLTVGPWVSRLGKPVNDVASRTEQFEAAGAEYLAGGDSQLDPSAAEPGCFGSVKWMPLSDSTVCAGTALP
jgi:hypothetical protein|tara:strand:+ start:160 stop:543 length:384 start_codon:yes stop_codon:yes gene_type:complete